MGRLLTLALIGKLTGGGRQVSPPVTVSAPVTALLDRAAESTMFEDTPIAGDAGGLR